MLQRLREIPKMVGVRVGTIASWMKEQCGWTPWKKRFVKVSLFLAVVAAIIFEFRGTIEDFMNFDKDYLLSKWDEWMKGMGGFKMASWLLFLCSGMMVICGMNLFSHVWRQIPNSLKWHVGVCGILFTGLSICFVTAAVEIWYEIKTDMNTTICLTLSQKNVGSKEQMFCKSASDLMMLRIVFFIVFTGLLMILSSSFYCKCEAIHRDNGNNMDRSLGKDLTFTLSAIVNPQTSAVNAGTTMEDQQERSQTAAGINSNVSTPILPPPSTSAAATTITNDDENNYFSDDDDENMLSGIVASTVRRTVGVARKKKTRNPYDYDNLFIVKTSRQSQSQSSTDSPRRRSARLSQKVNLSQQ